MTAQHSKGLTWNHPRGYRALEAAAEMANPARLHIRRERQPPDGFEYHLVWLTDDKGNAGEPISRLNRQICAPEEEISI